MKKSFRLAKLGLGIAVSMVIGAGAYSASAAFIVRPPCFACPMIYAPVLCPNGQVYSNSCFARCEGQTNCVPFWDPIFFE